MLNSTLTEEQMLHFEQIFHSLDRDGSGAIDIHELQHALVHGGHVARLAPSAAFS